MNYSNVYACILRYFYATRDYSRLFEFLFWPVIDIGWLGLIALWAGNMAENSQVVQVFIMALVLWQVIYRAHYEVCFNLLDEILDHNLMNMVASPLKKREWIAAMMISGLIKSIFTLFFGALVGYLFFRVNLFSLGMMLLPFAFLCVCSGWIVGFISAGFIILKGAKLQQIPWVAIMLIAIFSAVYYPMEVLPGYLQIIAKLFPMSYIFQGLREFILQGTLSMNYLWVATFLSIFYLALSIFIFLWLYEKSRKVGLNRLSYS